MSRTPPEPLLNETDQGHINKLMEGGNFEQARKAATEAVHARRALRTFGSIDAITTTSKRRRPKTSVSSLDAEFSGTMSRLKMIATARDLELNFSMTRGLIQQHLNYVVGRGPRLQIRTTDTEWNDRGEAFFKRWAKNPDVRGVMDFGRFIRNTERRTVVGGDFGIAMVSGVKLQGIEGDRIANPPDVSANDDAWVHGVNVNDVLRPLKYGVYARPSQMRRGSPRQGDFQKTFNRRNFILAFDPERFDQSRGISALISAINDMQDSREALEAVKGSIKLENLLGLFFATNTPESANANPLGALTNHEIADADGNNETRQEVKISQGVNVVNGLPGESVTAIQKQTPGRNFEPWMMFQIRLAAIALDMPLELAFQFYQRGSFSTLRGAIGQYLVAIRVRRDRIEYQILDKIGRWVLDSGIKLWKIEEEKGVPLDARRGLQPPQEGIQTGEFDWQWDDPPLLEPEKQIKGDVEEYKAKTTTLKDMNAKRNRDFEDTVRQQAREINTIMRIADEEKVDPNRLLPQVNKPGEVNPPPADEQKQSMFGRLLSKRKAKHNEE